MNAHEVVAEVCEQIRSELDRRGILSDKIMNGTYAIETLSRSYMADPEPSISWRELGFSASETRILSLLHRRLGSIVGYNAILEALYFDRREPDGTMNTLKVFLVKIRHKIHVKALPYRVETIWATGFRMTETG